MNAFEERRGSAQKASRGRLSLSIYHPEPSGSGTYGTAGKIDQYPHTIDCTCRMVAGNRRNIEPQHRIWSSKSVSIENSKARCRSVFWKNMQHRLLPNMLFFLMMSLFRNCPARWNRSCNFRETVWPDRNAAEKSSCGRVSGVLEARSSESGRELEWMSAVSILYSVFDSLRYLEKEDGIAWADAILCANESDGIESRIFFLFAFKKNQNREQFLSTIARGEHSPTADWLNLQRNIIWAVSAWMSMKSNLMLLRDCAAAMNPASSQVLHSALLHQCSILTPHNAFIAIEAVERKSKFTAEQMDFFLRNKKFKWQL